MKKNDTFRSIVTGMLLFSAMIFSSEAFAKDTIYVAEFPIENSNIKHRDLDDFRSTFVRNLVEHGSKDYIIQDDVLGKSLLRRVKKQQLYGSETDVGTLSNLASYKFEVEGFIRFDSGKYSLLFKLNNFEQNASLEKVIEKRNVSDYQMDYYLNELALAVLNSSYKINDASAPMRAEHNIKLSALTLSQSDMEIKKIDFNYSDDRAKQFTETFKPILQAGDTLYARKSFLEAIGKYNFILDSIQKNLTEDSIKVLSDYKKEIEARILSSYKNHFNEKFAQIDAELNSTSNIKSGEEEKFKSRYAKIEDEITGYQGRTVENVKEYYKNALIDRYSALIIKRLQTTQTEASNFLAQSKLNNAIVAMESIQKEETGHYSYITVFGKRIEYKESGSLSIFFTQIREKTEKLKKNISNLSTNKAYALCEIIEKSAASFEVMEGLGKGDTQEALDIASSVTHNYQLLYDGEFPEISKEAAYRRNEVLDLAKKSNAMKKFKKWEWPLVLDAEERYNSGRSLPLEIVLFPFKYIGNILLSAADMFKIEPLAGFGVGAESPLVHPNLGYAKAISSYSPSKGNDTEKWGKDTYSGYILSGQNECDGYVIDLYPYDHEKRNCKSKYSISSFSKINIWGAFFWGVHFEINLWRSFNILPEIFFSTERNIWYATETNYPYRFDYRYFHSLKSRVEWKIFEGKFTKSEAYTKCNSIGMKLPYYKEVFEIQKSSEFPKDLNYAKFIMLGIEDSGNILCVKEK